jgi:hypothetical protein
MLAVMRGEAVAGWSPSGAAQRDVGNRGKSGSARLALETTFMTVRPEGANHQ